MNRNTRWTVTVDGLAPHVAGLTIDVALQVYDVFQTRGHWHTGRLGAGQFCQRCERDEAVRS